MNLFIVFISRKFHSIRTHYFRLVIMRFGFMGFFLHTGFIELSVCNYVNAARKTKIVALRVEWAMVGIDGIWQIVH